MHFRAGRFSNALSNAKLWTLCATGITNNISIAPNFVYLSYFNHIHMKILFCLAFLLPIMATAQTKGDYQQAMATFQRFYNAGQGDSIYTLFYIDNPTGERGIKYMWSNEQTAEALKQFGTLKSFKYIGVDQTDADTVRVFQTFFSKAGAKTTSLTLRKDHKLGTFRFMTVSDGIDDLLKKRKASR